MSALSICVSMYHVHASRPWRIKAPGTGDTEGCKALCECWSPGKAASAEPSLLASHTVL